LIYYGIIKTRRNEKMDISKIFLNNDSTPKFKSSISFDYYAFIKMFMENLDSIEEELKLLRRTIKESFNYTYDSISIRVRNIYGQEFIFSFYGRDLFLWDHSGGTAICNVLLDDDLKIRKEQLNNIIRLAEKFTNGIIECGLCGKEINYQENRSHRYHAGIYCFDCWMSKIKEIEAKETYN